MDKVIETIGFDPDKFSEEVRNLINKEIESCVENIKKSILKSTEGKRTGTKDLKLTDEILNEPIKHLKNKLKKVFSKNMDKFDLYSRRNIFTIKDDSLTYMESEISSNVIDERIEETKKLSSELLELRQTHSNLATECKEVEQILADMKSSLFGLRVGAQVFEQLNIQPLSEAVANIVENKRNLLELVEKASGLTNQLIGTYDESESQMDIGDNIRTEDAEDIINLLQNISD